ncbi:MAG TPA: Hpt domain-containing protein [Bryobacteraceae bacterium]|jgi:two-component system sensor histidine kinase/response regulator|nr:Hpt domain-containing protein [Bryobacteraceae bacterium]
MSAPSMDPVLDREVALSRVGGDVELLKEIAVLFLSEYPKILDELRSAAERGDARRMERTAHSLKGSVSNFGACAAVEAARSLEAMGRARQLEQAVQVIRTLELALAALGAELEQL